MAWFPRLRELVTADCPKLASLPPIPWRIQPRCSVDIERVGSGIEQLRYGRVYGPELRVDVEGKGGHGDVLWNQLNFSNLTDVEYLYIDRCPLLPLDHMRVLTSLKRIMIWRTSSILPRVQGAGHAIYRFPCEDLNIIKCDTSGEELTLLLSFFPELSKLRIDDCQNITGLGVAENAETASEEQQQQQTRGDNNKEIITAAAASQGLLLLPPRIQDLVIMNCFSNTPNHNHAGGGGLQRLRSLRLLRVVECPDFFSSISSSSFPPFPTCLQHLSLWGVIKHMETLHSISNLTSLTELDMIILGESRAEGLWPLLAHGRLTKLHLETASGFFAGPDPSWPHDTEMFSRSSKLLDLSAGSNSGVLASPICSLLSSTLTRLHLSFDREVERLTKDQEEALQLLTSLQDLGFWSGYKLQSLPAGLHNLINLKTLGISWCSAIRSLPSLPSSLQELGIYKCGALKSLSSLPSSLRELEIGSCAAFKSLPNSLPSSLEKLKIFDCKAIKSLPKDGLPSSMLELDVHEYNDEELRRECRKLIGTIPIVKA